jgi:hypothetical protein
MIPVLAQELTAGQLIYTELSSEPTRILDIREDANRIQVFTEAGTATYYPRQVVHLSSAQ